ncbi:MAG: HesA/MoeB/ThiF family protein, partial [Patescibacteria group bacterium]
LHRQILYTQSDVGKLKVEVAAGRLRQTNPGCEVRAIPSRLTTENAPHIMHDFDIVINASDNFAATYVVNDVCVVQRKPMVHAAVEQFRAQLAVFDCRGSIETINYRDIFPTPPPAALTPNCSEAGILGAAPGLVGSVQALETIKLICNIESPLINHLLCFDLSDLSTQLVKIRPDPANPLRKPDVDLRTLNVPEHVCAVGAGPEVDFTTLMTWIQRKQQFQLVDVRSDEEVQAANFGGLHAPLESLTSLKFQPALNTPVVLYCASGMRSALGVAVLRGRFKTAALFSLTGGINALSSHGISLQELRKNFDSSGHLVLTSEQEVP